MAQVAPFHGGMHLGAGFNSYTQELRLDEAVIITLPPKPEPRPVTSNLSTASSIQQPKLIANNPIALRRKDETNFVAPIQAEAGSSAGASKEPIQAELPAVKEDVNDGRNAKLGAKAHDTLLEQVANDLEGPRFVLPTVHDGEDINANQSVTYSTRSISNMSDIMDALSISASTSIKYGTVHGNGSASFVNEDKIMDSQLNYLVSVRVNNNDIAEAESMVFKPIKGLTPDKFTEVYGDCFIAGFATGGEFNAIISIDCHDKSKASAVKEAVDLELATPVPGLTIGGGQSFGKSNSELLRGVEMTISVNWTGGGELKPPDMPWDLKTVIAAANAYPSMVARSAARISAILRPYTSLASFVNWQYEQYGLWTDKLDEFDSKTPNPDKKQESRRKALEEARDLWIDKTLILNYAPCQLYTNDLFNAYMQFKKMWKRISFIMSDTKKWRVRKREDIIKDIGHHRADSYDITESADAPRPQGPVRSNSRPSVKIPEPIQEGQVSKNLSATSTPASSTKSKDFAPQTPVPPTPHVGSLSRFDTFPLKDESIKEEWDLDKLNKAKDPISLDPMELNEARLLCREAMTLITEEAYSLVYHPDLAYAEYNKEHRTTRMKRPIYMYPEVLKARLPVFIRNDAVTSRRSRDPVILKLKQFDNNDLWANLIGDELNPSWTYRAFVSLERNESHDSPQLNNPLIGLSIHAYAHSRRYHFLPQWWADSHRAIGGFGFTFEGDKKKDTKDDGMTQWEGEYQSHDPRMHRKLMLRNPIQDMKRDADKDRPKEEHKHHFHMPDGVAKAFRPDDSDGVATKSFHEVASEDVDIQKIVISYVPGSGRISKMVFWDSLRPTTLAWQQWEGSEPSNMQHFENFPPRSEGQKWKFVGLMGDWVTDIMGNNKILSRVSGVWRMA